MAVLRHSQDLYDVIDYNEVTRERLLDRSLVAMKRHYEIKLDEEEELMLDELDAA